jgi:hypothetical protein
MISFTPTITSQSQSMLNHKSVYKKNLTLYMDGSPSGDTVVTFGNRKKKVAWVAGGGGTNKLVYSMDGINWTGIGGYLVSSWVLSISFNGTIWTVGGQGTNSLAYSYDGIHWTGLGTTIFTDHCHGVCWNQTMCVAVGIGTNTMAYSYDGIHWTGLGTSYLEYGITVAWNGNMWIAIGGSTVSKRMVYSYDGIQWFRVPTIESQMETSGLFIAWNGTMWMAGGEGANSISYSYDGLTWTGANSTPLLKETRGIAWNGTLWVAVGVDSTGKGSIAYSYNGTLWTRVTNDATLFTEHIFSAQHGKL